MKKFFGIAVVALLGLSAPAFAQEKVKEGAKKVWKGTKKGAKKVGNKTAELTTKGVSKVKDEKSEIWVGPEGQTIYLTGDERYYWVNGSGKRIYVSQAALKAKNK